MQEFDFMNDPAETAAMSIAADKMPLTPHLIALQLSDFIFGKPSLRDANQETSAQQFIQNFLKNIPSSLLDLHDEDALHAELTLLTENYFPQKTSEQIQDHIAEMLNEIEDINTRFPKDRWDKLRDHLRPTWEKQFLGHASHPSIVNQKIFVEDALEEIKYRLPHTRDIDSLFWREGGAAEQMLGNLYTISTTTGEHLAEGLKRLETFTETPLPKDLKRSITEIYLEQKLDEPYFSEIMAMPTLKERLEALGPIADKALVGGRKALETALRTLDAAYDATKQFGQEERAKAIAKWGVEHVQGFELTVALLGFMLQNGTAPSINNNNNPLPLPPAIAVVEKMAAPKPTVTVISGTPKESSWVEKVGKKATDLHKKISQKSPTNIKHLRPTPKNGTLLDTEPSKKKSAYMDQHTVGYTHQKLAHVDSDQGLIDVFMDKWIWEVEDYSGKRYFDGMKTKEYPDGYPTIGLGYNLARNNAFETGKELLGWTDKTFKAYCNGEKTLSKADAKKLARHDLKEMLGELKNTLGDECWEKLNAPQRFAALDLYYNNPSALMGKETVRLFQEAAASGDFEKIAATIADKRNASDLGGSNLRRLANAEFVAGQDMSLKSKALVRQVISPAIKKANDGDTILVRVTRIASIPQAKHMEQYVTLAEGKTVTVVPVMQENVNGVACDVPCGKAISVVGTPKGIDAQAIALDSAALSTGYLFGGTKLSFSQR